MSMRGFPRIVPRIVHLPRAGGLYQNTLLCRLCLSHSVTVHAVPGRLSPTPVSELQDCHDTEDFRDVLGLGFWRMEHGLKCRLEELNTCLALPRADI